jgi:hypothetical protein
MSVLNLNNITDAQISANGVRSLADRPNSNSQYGVGGLSSNQLKLWFDKLATFLAGKINELQGKLGSKEAAKYIGIALHDNIYDNTNENDVLSLQDLLDSFESGKFAERILLCQPDSTSGKATIQNILYSISETLSLLKEKCGTETHLSFVSDTSTLTLKLLNGVGETRSIHSVDLKVTEERLANGAVTTPKIANNSITNEKIASNSVNTAQLKDSSVTTEKIEDKVITKEKLSVSLSKELSAAYKGFRAEYDKNEAVIKFIFIDGEDQEHVVTLDTNLESTLVDIDDYELNGILYLRLTLANGTKKDIALNEIFKGYLKTQNKPHKVYGSDSSGNECLYDIEAEETIGEHGSIVRRNSNGSILVPIESLSDESAVPKKYVDNTLGSIDETLSQIIKIQNQYIGGNGYTFEY